MSKVICIMGESGSGKTTSMRNLDPRKFWEILLVRLLILAR